MRFREALFDEEQRETRQKLQQEWRMSCPEGHTQLNLMMVPTVYCIECKCAYDYEDLVDRR